MVNEFLTADAATAPVSDKLRPGIARTERLPPDDKRVRLG